MEKFIINNIKTVEDIHNAVAMTEEREYGCGWCASSKAEEALARLNNYGITVEEITEAKNAFKKLKIKEEKGYFSSEEKYFEEGFSYWNLLEMFIIFLENYCLEKIKFTENTIFGEIKGDFEEGKAYLLADGEVIDNLPVWRTDSAKDNIYYWRHAIGKQFAEKVGPDAYKQVIVVTDDGEKHLFAQSK